MSSAGGRVCRAPAASSSVKSSAIVRSTEVSDLLRLAISSESVRRRRDGGSRVDAAPDGRLQFELTSFTSTPVRHSLPQHHHSVRSGNIPSADLLVKQPPEMATLGWAAINALATFRIRRWV